MREASWLEAIEVCGGIVPVDHCLEVIGSGDPGRLGTVLEQQHIDVGVRPALFRYSSSACSAACTAKWISTGPLLHKWSAMDRPG